ncbi:MAG: hypothetical protein PHH77_04910 [Victivallaceae bacterium]|nr:hypothetical protein [Victivallaceae bacterium]
MSKRKSIGPTYASYPARNLGLWLGDKTFKVVASAVCLLLWWGVYWVLLGVVNFNKNTFMEGAKQTTVNELFKDDLSLLVLGISSVLVCVLVFRSRIGDRQTRKKKR